MHLLELLKALPDTSLRRTELRGKMADDNATPGAKDGDPMADLEGLRKVLEDGNLEQTLKVYIICFANT